MVVEKKLISRVLGTLHADDLAKVGAGLSAALSYAGGLFHGIAGSRRRAARMAIHESVLNGGYIVGASVTGLLYQQFSMKAVVGFCLGCSITAILVQGFLLSRMRSGVKR